MGVRLLALLMLLTNPLLTTTRANSCDVSLTSLAVELDQESFQIFCPLTNPQWTRTDGNDLCAANTDYSRCGGTNLCTIPRDDFLLGELTFFCCRSGTEQQRCWQIIINPVVNHTVPHVVRAGKVETAYSVVMAKPRPATFPGVEVQLELKTGNTTAFTTREINSTVEVSPHPSQPLTYVAFHTFPIPLDTKESSTLRLHFDLPADWSSLDNLVYPDIGVITVPEGTTGPESESPSTDGNGGEGSVGTDNCPDLNDVIISSTVVGGVLSVLCTALLLLVICCICYCKNKRKSESSPVEVPSPSPTQPAPPPPITNVPDNLQIRPWTPNSNTNSTTTTPGLTPMGELTGLLSGSAGGVAIDHTTVAVNSAHLRQHSRDSGSTTTTTTTTPTEGDRLLPSSAGLTGSTGQTSSTCITGLTGCNSGSCVPLPSLSRATTEIAQLPNGHLVSGQYPPTSRTTFENSDKTVVSGEMRDSSGGPGNVPPGWSEVTKVKSTDPKHHVYSTVGEGCKTMKLEYHGASLTLTTGSGLSAEHQSSFSHLYQQDHERNWVTLSASSTLPSTFSMCPPLPADKPEYASHGSKMHLHPQFTENVSAV